MTVQTILSGAVAPMQFRKRQAQLPLLLKGKRVLCLDDSNNASDAMEALRLGAKEILCVDAEGNVRQLHLGFLRSLHQMPAQPELKDESFDVALARLSPTRNQSGFEQLCEKLYTWLDHKGELLLTVEHDGYAKDEERPRFGASSYVNRLLLCGFEIRQLEETEDFNAFVALAGKQ